MVTDDVRCSRVMPTLSFGGLLAIAGGGVEAVTWPWLQVPQVSVYLLLMEERYGVAADLGLLWYLSNPVRPPRPRPFLPASLGFRHSSSLPVQSSPSR